MAFYVVSERGYMHHIAWGVTYEFEDVIARTCGATILTPRMASLARFHWKWDVLFGRWLPYLKTKDFRFAQGERNLLLLVGMGPGALRMLDSLPRWRERCDVVAAFIPDVYQPAIDQLATPKFRKITDRLDHLFVSYEQSMPKIQEVCRAPVSLVLQAADALAHGAHGGERWIDLIGYGRRHEPTHKKLAAAFNRPRSPHLYYHSTFRFRQYPEVDDYRAMRALLYQLLRRAKLSVNYRFTHTSPGMAHGICPLTARWFEAVAAGAVLVGTKPTGPEAAREFEWPDAVIDFPEETADPVGFVTALLEDEPRLRRASQRNYYEALRRHDWRHRIRDILTALKEPIPLTLQSELEQLQQQAEAVGPGGDADAAANRPPTVISAS